MAQIKTKDELKKIEKACHITDEIFKLILKQKSFSEMSEIELRDFILSEIKKRGLKPSFPPIVSGGVRAGNEIHPKPTEAKLKGFVIIDFGVVCDKYMSDMTRTIFVGLPSAIDREIYKKVLDSQEHIIKLAKAGVKAGELDQSARKMLGKYAKYFIHTLGHGLGRKIHELPRIYYKDDKTILRENMAITIEPGIYLKRRFGIRIEDTCIVGKHGLKVLTKSPKI